MRKHYLTLCIVPLLLGCQDQKAIVEEEVINEKSYDNYYDLKIEWEDLFKQDEASYIVYIYSETCYYCNKIKNDIFNFIDKDFYPIYLINFNKDIPVFNELECTIGATSIDNVWIGGTPNLIHIVNRHVFMNIAGAEKITNYLDLFSCNYNSLLNELS